MVLRSPPQVQTVIIKMLRAAALEVGLSRSSPANILLARRHE